MAGDLLISLAGALRHPPAPSSDYDLNPDVRLHPKRRLRAAAVLIPIDLTGACPTLWLTKRSSALQHHPGQISCPGGKQDEADIDLAGTALRRIPDEANAPGP